MDFLSKLFKPTHKSGSGPSLVTRSPNPSPKSEHETYVEFAREFVEELVENLPDSSGKNIQSAAKLLNAEDSTSITSVILSEKSCDALPDLLQPESVYKKQTDTDTDTSHTTEYESAVETDAQDSSSLNDGLLSDEIFDAAENSVDQHKSHQGVYDSFEVHIIQKGDDKSKVVNLDNNLEVLSCKPVEETSHGASILLPLEVCNKSDISSDFVQAGESAHVTTTVSKGDISALCIGLANLDLDTSVQSASGVPVLNEVEVSNNSVSTIVADSSFDICELDTIHLVETEEHELSVLVLDAGDVYATPELSCASVDADQSISNSENNPVDALTVQSCDVLPGDKSTTSLHCLLNAVAVNDIEKGLGTLSHESSQNSVLETHEAVKLPTFESVKLSTEEDNPIVEVLDKKVEDIIGLVAGSPSGKQENTDVEVNKEHCVQNVNVSLDAVGEQFQSDKFNSTRDIDVVNPIHTIPSESFESITSSTNDFDIGFENFKDLVVEEVKICGITCKEFIDQVHSTIEDSRLLVEEISPTSQQHEQLVTGDPDVSCEFKESIVKEPTCAETPQKQIDEQDKSPFETIQECTFEEIKISGITCKELFDQVQSTIEDKKPFVEKISPTSQHTQLVGDANLTCEFKESIVKELVFAESPLEPIVKVDKSTFEPIQKCAVEEINLSGNTCKEFVDQVQSTIEDKLPSVEKISPTSQHKQLVIGDINLSCEFKESIVKELVFAESPRELIVEVHKSTFEPIQECAVEKPKGLIDPVHSPVKEDGNTFLAISPTSQLDKQLVGDISLSCELKDSIVEEKSETFEPIRECNIKSPNFIAGSIEETPVKVVFSPGIKNKEDIVEVEPQVDNIRADSYSSQEHSGTSQKQKHSNCLESHDVGEGKSSVNANSLVPLDEIKVNQAVIVEPSLCNSNQLDKSNQETLVALPLIEAQKLPVDIPESVTSSVNVGPFSPLPLKLADEVSVHGKNENTVLTQVTSPGISLDFDDLAAEAANVSNDFLNASQEIGEPDFIGGSETSVLLTQAVTMTDTKPEENVGSVPLDVKWLADSQNNSHNNRISNVSVVKPADASPRLKTKSSSLTDGRTSVIDCTNEDPFKRRSLLRSSPPRDVPHTNDNKSAMPLLTSTKMEKGAGESLDIKENHSEAGPDTAEALSISGEEIFKDPADFEFLSSMASTQPLRDYRKESLYVKFDPLVGSNPIVRTDKNIPLPPVFQESTRAGDTARPIEISVSPKHTTPVKNPALDLIDRLISLTPSPKKPEPPKPPPVVKEPVQHTSPEQEAMNEELYVLRELLDHQDKAHQQQLVQHKAEIEALQNKLSVTERLYREAEEREQNLNKKVTDKAQGQKQMSMIMDEYEKTISRLVAEKEAEHQAHELEKETITKEKELALQHLTNIEIAFSDVHLKYERSKQVIEGFKKNEEVLRASLADYESSLQNHVKKYELLKSHAMQELERANQELEVVKRSQHTENAKLHAMLKKSELKSSSLEEMLEQKIKENQELASICDDLISKVGN